MGEVLLCPKPLGLIEMPDVWVNTIHNEINAELEFDLHASTRIVVQPIGEQAWFFHNYNKTKEEVTFSKSGLSKLKLVDGFTGDEIKTDGNVLKLTLEPISYLGKKY